jgi:hypothetical protein
VLYRILGHEDGSAMIDHISIAVRDFVIAAAGSGAVYTSGRISFDGYINMFGAVRHLGGGQNLAYATQAAASLSAAALVAVVWHRKLLLPVRAATLASAALVAAPLALFYDLMLGAVAALWLLRSDRRNRLSDWEKLALTGLFLLSLSPRLMAASSHLPVGPFIALALMGLVAAHALRHQPAPAKSIVTTGDTTAPSIGEIGVRP